MRLQKTFLEFFAGIGLIRWALEREGWRCLFANDIDESKRITYAANFPAAHYVVGDVGELDATQVPSALLATAGFPCTDLSLAGAREGLRGSESGSFWGFTQVLESMGENRPPLVLIENVPGFLTSHKGADFRAAVQELNRLGYRCDPFLIDASCFVPQSRVRLFIVGALDRFSLMPPFSESVLFSQESHRSRALANAILRNTDLKWSIKSLPSLPAIVSSLSDVVETLPKNDPAWWSGDRVNKLMSQMNETHLGRVESRRASTTTFHATAYRRMRNGVSTAEVRDDGVAGCLRTPRGGSSRQIFVVAGCGTIRARYMTPREYARLQGVSDDYVIPGRSNQGLFGFGDAVCVPVIRWIAQNYLTPLALRLARGLERAS